MKTQSISRPALRAQPCLVVAPLLALAALALAAPAFAQGNSGKGGGNKEPAAPTLPAVRYELELLDTLDTLGLEGSWTSGMNSWGDVVGTAYNRGGPQRAFISSISATDGYRYLDDLNDLLSEEDSSKFRLSGAQAINDVGEIVGRGSHISTEGPWVSFPFRLSPQVDGYYHVENLTDFGDNLYAINAAGNVAGEYQDESGQTHAFRTVPGEEFEEFEALGVLYDHHKLTRPAAINWHGHVVGMSFEQPGEVRAFLYTSLESGMQDLGYFKSERGGYSNGFAYDLNDSVEVVGSASAGGWKRHAFRWSDGVLKDLGTFGGDRSEGRGINNLGEIVGRAQDSSGTYHAFLYLDDFGLIKLQDLVVNGPLSPDVFDNSINMRINDAGVIMGTCLIEDVRRAYVLTPVPEP